MPFVSPDKSRVKMVGLTGPKYRNIIWYSPVWQNNKPLDQIIAGMMRRFTEREESKLCQVIQFYDMSCNRLIEEFR